MAGPCSGFQWQGEDKPCATFGGILSVDLAAVFFDGLLAYRQAKACALGFAMSGKGLEQSFQDGVSNAWTGVLQGGDQFLPHLFHTDEEASRRIHRVASIGGQVGKNPAQALGVSLQGDFRDVPIKAALNLFQLQGRAKLIEGVEKELAVMEGLWSADSGSQGR